MPPSTEHTCTRCQAKVVFHGARVFVPRPCPGCGAILHVRDELGGYRLHELLARNGLGVIFRGISPVGTSAAVKILQPPLAAPGDAAAQFVSRVRTLADMDLPNCPRIYDAGIEHGAAWVTMEWLPHGSLATRLRERGRLPEAEVLAIGLQAAAALGAVDAAGLRHRDLEPNNLVFGVADVVKVTDFAQAALYQSAADDLGSVWGRAAYISPERLRNEEENAPSDIYSLGATIYQALTGTPLFDGEPHGQITLELLTREEVRVEKVVPTVHEATARVLNRMLVPDLARRFRSWSEVTAQLREAAILVAQRDSLKFPVSTAEAVPAEESRRSPGWFWFWMSVVLAVLIGLATLVAWQQRLGS